MRTSLEQHLGSRQVGRVVYGSIIGMALVVTLDSHPPTASVMTVWLVGTAVAGGLAEVYSGGGGGGTSMREPGRGGEVDPPGGGARGGGGGGGLPGPVLS